MYSVHYTLSLVREFPNTPKNKKNNKVQELPIRAIFGTLPRADWKVRQPKISRADGSDGSAVCNGRRPTALASEGYAKKNIGDKGKAAQRSSERLTLHFSKAEYIVNGRKNR